MVYLNAVILVILVLTAPRYAANCSGYSYRRSTIPLGLSAVFHSHTRECPCNWQAINPTGIAQVVVENRAFNQPDSVNVLQDGFYALPVGATGVRTGVFTQQVVLNLLVSCVPRRLAVPEMRLASVAPTRCRHEASLSRSLWGLVALRIVVTLERSPLASR